MRIKRLLYAIATILPFLFLCSCYEEQEPQQEKQDKEKWTMQVAGNQLNEFLNITEPLRLSGLGCCADYKGAERYSFILRPCSGYNS
jgi:hypothetical protein